MLTNFNAVSELLFSHPSYKQYFANIPPSGVPSYHIKSEMRRDGVKEKIVELIPDNVLINGGTSSTFSVNREVGRIEMSTKMKLSTTHEVTPNPAAPSQTSSFSSLLSKLQKGSSKTEKGELKQTPIQSPLHKDVVKSKSHERIHRSSTGHMSKAELKAASEAISKEDEARKKKKGHVVAEIISTEKSYVAHLSTLRRLYVEPLKGQIAKGKDIISRDRLNQIFLNVDVLCDLNMKLLHDLELLSSSSSSSVGQVFLTYAPFFKIYANYIDRCDLAFEELAKEKKCNKVN